MKDYPLAQWLPSPNFTRGRSKPVDAVVIHHTDGQPRLERAVKHLQKTRADYLAEGRDRGPVSAHFLVGQAGEVVQLVRLEDTAWHASGVNACTVGIEHIARTPGELGKDDPGLPLTATQLDASAALVRWLCRRFALPVDSRHIVPHCRVVGTTHLDCGRDVAEGGIWDWRGYFRRLELLDPAAMPTMASTP